MDTLAKRVKTARAQRKMRQEDLASASGLKQSDISKIENGLILKTTGVVALARALRVDPHWLATGEGEMVSSQVWPFALLTPDQLFALSPEHLGTVEKVALDLLRSQKVPKPPTVEPAENEPSGSGELKTFKLTTKRKMRSGTSARIQKQHRQSGGG